MRYAIEEPGTFFAEAVRAVRLAIQRTLRSEPIKIIVVTSAVEGEGKTIQEIGPIVANSRHDAGTAGATGEPDAVPAM